MFLPYNHTSIINIDFFPIFHSFKLRYTHEFHIFNGKDFKYLTPVVILAEIRPVKDKSCRQNHKRKSSLILEDNFDQVTYALECGKHFVKFFRSAKIIRLKLHDD